MKIKPIKTEEQYQEALDTIESLMNCAPDTEESDLLEVLAILVSFYEDIHYPIPSPSVKSVLEFYIDTKGWTVERLAEVLDTYPGDIRELIAGRNTLSSNLMRKLYKELNVDAEVLLTQYNL